MIQQINLYQDALKTQRVVMSALTIGSLFLALLLLLAALFAISRWELAGAHERLRMLEADIAAGTEELRTLTAAADRGPSPALQRRVSEAREELAAKRRLLTLLGGSGPSNLAGFSDYLQALGRRHIEGLWLTQIVIADGGAELLLKGSTTDERHVPAYLQALAQEPVYAGREFNAFRLVRTGVDEPRLDFTVVTQCRDRDGVELAPELCASQAERRQ